MTHVPERTCIGCRTRAPANELVRCAYSDEIGMITVDDKRSMPGRGAWIHPRSQCVIHAMKARAFTRALKLVDNGKQVTLDEAALERLNLLPHPVRKSRAVDD